MEGKIRTKETCPKCKGKFSDEPLCCPTCLIEPTKYYIDIFWKKRYRLYTDKNGYLLDSWPRAHRLLENIRSEMDRKVFDPKDYLPERKTFYSFQSRIQEWFKEKETRVKKGDLAPSYVKELRRYIDKFYTPFFKESDIREIRTGDVESFYQILPAQLALKTVKNIMGALQNFFFEMSRKEYIRRCPQFPKIVPPEPDWRWIDEKTQNALIEAIPDQHRPIFIFMARQAVRPGEARALQWEDIDFEREVVTIRRTFSLDKMRNFTKTKRIRYLPLHPRVLEHLKKIRGISGFVFRNGDRPYSTSTLFYHWKEAKGKMGITGRLRLYDGTRHSVASQAVNRGVDLNLIGKALGHTKTEMTRRYAHIMTETLRQVFVSPDCPQEEKGDTNLLKIKDNKP
ncbi:MAG: site-specific integrase [Nitrospirae bacterium]|nr:site-specific integrase [Nitrospirota bacterium]